MGRRTRRLRAHQVRLDLSTAITVVSPVLVSLVLFVVVGALRRDAPPAAEEITRALAHDAPAPNRPTAEPGRAR